MPGYHDGTLVTDAAVIAIDAMEERIAPLDEQASAIRGRIGRFEACYHEADKEAELIVRAIASGQAPAESGERPAQRKTELENCRDILSAWCDDAFQKVAQKSVGKASAEDVATFIGKRTPLKVWQVRRIVDRVEQALDPACRYHNMALDMDDYGEPGASRPGEYYRKDAGFLQQTVATIIHDSVDGQKGETSLALAVDLFMPCHWDFVGSLVTILRAIGGQCRAEKPLAYCARNIRLSPLCDKLRTISDTLITFWNADTGEHADARLLASLGGRTPVKRWLAGSLGKTIELQLESAWA